MPHGITQCYLPPGRGDIPALAQPKLVPAHPGSPGHGAVRRVCCDCQVRSLEVQMEEEQSERQKLMREKRDVERRMQALSEQQPARNRGDTRAVAAS